MQKRIIAMLNAAPGISVIGAARDGFEAIDMVNRLDPDVVTMDIRMPRMGGVEAVERIMASRPKPIVIFSSYSRRDTAECMAALALGVVGVVEKPDGSVSLDLDTVRDQLIEQVRIAGRVRVVRNACRTGSVAIPKKPPGPVPGEPLVPRQPRREPTPRSIVCIASSTGGPGVLGRLLPALPANFPLPVVIAQHMPGRFTGALSEQLGARSRVVVKEAANGDLLMPGTVYIAPGSSHLRVLPQGRLETVPLHQAQGPAPSADLLLESAAECLGSGVVAVVLTGMGSDGARGAAAVRKAGGRTLAQDEASSAVFGMPRAAIETGAVDRVLGVEEIAAVLNEIAVSGRGGDP